MDWIGILVFMASTTSLLFGITVGGTVYAWTSFRTLLPLVLGAVGLFVFVLVELYIPKEPMVPLKVFLSRTAASAYLGTFLHGMVCDPSHKKFVLILVDHLEPYHLFSVLVSISANSHASSGIHRYHPHYPFFHF